MARYQHSQLPSCEEEINRLAISFQSARDFAPLVEQIKNKKVVMFGEATHGTHEFYQFRAALTQELIQKHGFHFVAVEGDWPPCEEINQFVRNRRGENIYKTLARFTRWPTWMWANSEVACFADWLRRRNGDVGFHGLDVYSLFESIDTAITQIQKLDPLLAEQAKRHYRCFDSYRHNEKAYARSLFTNPEGCKEEALAALAIILEKRINRIKLADEILFDAIQNARIVVNAEQYYRTMVQGDGDSWNVRDKHMMQTLEILLQHYGPNSKGIVWEHNTHIGDYRSTSMLEEGQVNIGGLARERLGANSVALIGFGTYHGTVIASHSWDGPALTMPVPRAFPNSIEDELHRLATAKQLSQFYMLFDKASRSGPLATIRGHRAIGVVYNPEHERWGNYVPTSLSNRYDAFIYFDKSRALEPLALQFDHTKIPETWPSDSLEGST